MKLMSVRSPSAAVLIFWLTACSSSPGTDVDSIVPQNTNGYTGSTPSQDQPQDNVETENSAEAYAGLWQQLAIEKEIYLYVEGSGKATSYEYFPGLSCYQTEESRLTQISETQWLFGEDPVDLNRSNSRLYIYHDGSFESYSLTESLSVIDLRICDEQTNTSEVEITVRVEDLGVDLGETLEVTVANELIAMTKGDSQQWSGSSESTPDSQYYVSANFIVTIDEIELKIASATKLFDSGPVRQEIVVWQFFSSEFSVSSFDADNDGYSNLIELVNGTDPFNSSDPFNPIDFK